MAKNKILNWTKTILPAVGIGILASLLINKFGLGSIVDKYNDTISWLDDNIFEKFFGASVSKLLLLIGATIVFYWIMIKGKNKIIVKLEQFAKTTSNIYDDTLIEKIKNIGPFFYLIITLFISTKVVGMSGGILYNIISVAAIFFIILNITKLTDTIIAFFLSHKKGTDGKREVDLTIKNLINIIVKGFLWIIAFFVIFDALGVNLTGLVAGAGVTAVIFGFALQNVMSDVFSSVSIYFDQPFKVGDYVSVGTDTGTVSKIGFKSTRIKTLQGEELTISNKDLTAERIRNFRKMTRRRVSFDLGVTYNTTAKQMKTLPKVIEKIAETVEHLEFSRSHFTTFADHSLVIKTVYFINSRNYETYLDAQQEMNLKIMTTFEEMGVEFAFPTQTIHIEK